jgi:hypothetical protein
MAHRLLEIQKERKISGHQGLFSEKKGRDVNSRIGP